MYKRNPTYEGARAESWFANECIKLNIIPSKPRYDLGRYDFVIDNRINPLMKIQVKKLHYSEKYNNFSSMISRYVDSKPQRYYTEDFVDYFVFVALADDKKNPLTEDAIYIVPCEECAEFTNVYFCPHRKARNGAMATKLEKWRDRWDLLKGREIKDAA